MMEGLKNWLKKTFLFEKLWNKKCLCLGVDLYFNNEVSLEFILLRWTFTIYLRRG